MLVRRFTAIAVLLSLSVAICSCRGEKDDRENRIQLDEAGLEFDVPEDFEVVERERIVDPEGNVALNYRVARLDATNERDQQILVVRAQNGTIVLFDPNRDLGAQLSEFVERTGAGGFDVVKAEVRQIDGRPGLEVAAEKDTVTIRQAFVPVEDGTFVAIIGDLTTSDEARQIGQSTTFSLIIDTIEIRDSEELR